MAATEHSPIQNLMKSINRETNEDLLQMDIPLCPCQYAQRHKLQLYTELMKRGRVGVCVRLGRMMGLLRIVIIISSGSITAVVCQLKRDMFWLTSRVSFGAVGRPDPEL
eukprot:2403931-Amphidinium_carterae.1